MEFLTHKNDDASALAEMSGTDCERRSVFMKPNTQGGGCGGGGDWRRERCLEILVLGRMNLTVIPLRFAKPN